MLLDRQIVQYALHLIAIENREQFTTALIMINLDAMARKTPTADGIILRSVGQDFAVREQVNIRWVGTHGDKVHGGPAVVDVADAGAGNVVAVVVADDEDREVWEGEAVEAEVKAKAKATPDNVEAMLATT